MNPDSQCLPALTAGNEVFHAAYGATRDGTRNEVPILVLLPSELALHCHNERRGFPYSRPAFERAKSVAHIAVALFALTGTESNDARTRQGLSRLAEHVAGALAQLRSPRAAEAIDEEIGALLDTCQRFAGAALHSPTTEPVRAEFARLAGPRILRITELATSVQIAGLHAAVDSALGCLSPAEVRAVQVVVLGDHQARARSLGMQYFQRRFRERPSTDERVTYGENISSEEEAIALVGTRRLDQQIARAFFGDEKRLQRDILGDAATRCLDGMQFDG